MPVPDFQALMLPLLRMAAGGEEHSLSEARERRGADLKLTRAEQDELLPSGRQSRFANRVAWARVCLEQGGLLLSPQRGHFVVSNRRREVLKTPPARIDIKFLSQYPEFIEFRTPKRGGQPRIRGAGPSRGWLPGILRGPCCRVAVEDGLWRVTCRRRTGHWQGR